MPRVLTIGEMVIDFLPGSEPASYIRKAGGAPANVAIAVRRQGCDAAFCGMLGDDDFGRFLLDTLRENRVEPCIPHGTSDATTTMAFVTLDASGDRSFTFARKPGADMLLTKEHIRPDMLEKADIIHAGSCSLSKEPAAGATAYALSAGHAMGKLVSFDVNYRNLIWNDDRAAAAAAVQSVLPFVDLLKISEEEADMLGGPKALPACTQKYGISLLMETLGGNGAVCFWNGQKLAIDGLPASCVDTCGAGDAFWGAFLTGLLQAGVRKPEDLSAAIIRAAMQRGNIAGWLCVQKKGAIESLPTAEQTEQYRKEFYA